MTLQYYSGPLEATSVCPDEQNANLAEVLSPFNKFSSLSYLLMMLRKLQEAGIGVITAEKLCSL